MKKIAITGASGFVGTNLDRFFSSKGYDVISITRDTLTDEQKLVDIVNQSDIIINLAGANIINRWSESYKKILYSSRIDTTKSIVDAISKSENKPSQLISTSAIGIYKTDKEYDENDTDYNDDFLAKLCIDWESEAKKAEEFGVGVSIFRFGIVLGSDGGALAKMLLPFRLGLGGNIGSGKQPFSFVHIDDLIKAYDYVIDKAIFGVFNLTAPNYTTNGGLTKSLGSLLNRPTFFSVPEFVLKLVLSEGAKVLTDGQKVLPKHLLGEGFEFEFDNIDKALDDLV
jgi:uncharacterized protein (TIGR01777 family)